MARSTCSVSAATASRVARGRMQTSAPGPYSWPGEWLCSVASRVSEHMAERREDRPRGWAAPPLEHPPRHSQASLKRTKPVSVIRGHGGFTLLELLVVLVLIAVLTSIISIGSAPDPRQALAEQARRLGLLLALASDEARIRPQPISWKGDRRGYP